VQAGGDLGAALRGGAGLLARAGVGQVAVKEVREERLARERLEQQQAQPAQVAGRAGDAEAERSAATLPSSANGSPAGGRTS
jgi:hypothetical protein